MLFNSIVFLVFFSIFFFLFYYMNGTWRKWLLLLASCIFYMWFIPVYVLILFLTIGIDYFAAIKIEDDKTDKAKRFHLWFGIINTCLVLFIFKYHNFFIDNFNALGLTHIEHWDIILPIGLSFHTFQSLSYVVEVYRGNIKAERSLLTYSNFVMMFPQLVAGPIERANNMLPQLRTCDHTISYRDFSIGFHRFFWGLFKKVVVADTASVFVDATYNNYMLHPGSMLLVGTALFAVQIYCDFSGYSDMAIGIARMLGFRFRENFAIPYFSKDITEFWRRWHISLSSWLRDYLYISFGGNRYGQWKTYRNLMLTMLLGGLWHGASWNFVIWGGINGLYLSIEKMTNLPAWKPKFLISKLMRVAYVFILICLTWVFFRAVTFEQATGIIGKIFTGFNPSGFQFLDVNVFSSIAIGIGTLFAFEYIVFRNLTFDQLFDSKKGQWKLMAMTIFFFMMMLFFGNSTGNQFIYFQF
ncbi:MAG TPA: MBOAT family O-acyltransferase [Ferruginibacter sp.]|nr:MBOAT family O-acyltransferase [Ferruginibacter sp.]